MFIFEASFIILAVIAGLVFVFAPVFVVVAIVVAVMYLTVALIEASIHYLRFKRWRLLPYRELFPGVYAGTWRGGRY